MITYTKRVAREGIYKFVFHGLSTDTKPTNTFEGATIENGSQFLELDSGKVFLYDAEHKAWNQFK